jgi:hypothetical protein
MADDVKTSDITAPHIAAGDSIQVLNEAYKIAP